MTVINNFTTWQRLMTLVNVSQNGQIPPTVFNNWYNEVSDWYFKKLAEEYAINQILSDFLSPFTLYANIIVTPQPGGNFGIAVYPANYEFFLNGSILVQAEEDTCFCNQAYPIIDAKGNSKRWNDPDMAQLAINFAGANIEERQLVLIDLQRWPSCLEHKTKGATIKKPKMTQFQGGFKVAPKGVNSILLYYLKTPVKSVFSYTIVNDIAIYDATGSTQLEWSEQVTPIFLAELQKK